MALRLNEPKNTVNTVKSRRFWGNSNRLLVDDEVGGESDLVDVFFSYDSIWTKILSNAALRYLPEKDPDP